MIQYGELFYLLAAALLILGLKRLTSPATARRGNFLAATGMLVAITVALLDEQVAASRVLWVAGGLVLGSGIGLYLARTVEMTAMPQMVALLNGCGGGASGLVAAAEFVRLEQLYAASRTAVGDAAAAIPAETGIAIQLGVLVGGITFSGSAIAFGKLQEWITGKPVTYPLQKPSNALLLVVTLGMLVYLIGTPSSGMFVAFSILSLAVGVLFVLPIGGADMPVVISLLNSFSGVAASIAGFVIHNNGLIVGGALVGASGLILTHIMCKGMNRSLANVLFGAFGGAITTSGPGTDSGDKIVREVQAADAAVMLAYARLVIVVPGYGLAVAQAQHVVRELAQLLETRGVDVKYAIHPVAGRMPGHMNVLLAEADVSYDNLYDMDSINPEFERADVAVVIGANDVVNPAARSDTSSPIYGMPILNVDKAGSTIVLKRSMRPGFAGIENALFYEPRTHMLFGDAKASVQALIQELKDL